MEQEYAFDKLARVFDNVTASYVAESQRKQQLEDQRAYAEKTKADDRNYSKSVRDEERGYVKDDRVDARTYAKSVVDDERTYAKNQRGDVRKEQREDAEWANNQATINELIRSGYLLPSDAKDPAKINAAVAKMSPEAKQRLADHKQAIDEIGKLVFQFGTGGIAGAELPELLSP